MDMDRYNYIASKVYEKLSKKVGAKVKQTRRGIIEKIMFRKYTYTVDPKLVAECIKDVINRIAFKKYVLFDKSIIIDEVIDEVIKEKFAGK